MRRAIGHAASLCSEPAKYFPEASAKLFGNAHGELQIVVLRFENVLRIRSP